MDLGELQKNWNSFGERDPMWAILTQPDKVGGKWSVGEFFDSGEEHVAALVDRLRELGLATSGSMLDFGCGIGRLTQAFATRFVECWGVDIAPSMVEQARVLNCHGDRVRYAVNDSPHLQRFRDGSFDLVFSVIVLQHVRPELSIAYVREFFRVCKPGGTVVFQLPSHLTGEPLPHDAYVAEINVSPPARLRAGEPVGLAVRVRNAGSVTWPAGGDVALRVGNHWLDEDGGVARRDDGRAPLPRDLAPGDRVDLTLAITPPARPGRYLLEVDVVHEGVTWFAERGSPVGRLPADVVGAAGGSLLARIRRGLGRGEPAAAVSDTAEEPVMEMYGVPRDNVEALIRSLGAELLVVERNDYAHPWESFTYYARASATDSKKDA